MVPLVDSPNAIKEIDKNGYELLSLPEFIYKDIPLYIQFQGDTYFFTYGGEFFKYCLSSEEIVIHKTINQERLFLKNDLITSDIYPLTDDVLLCVGSGYQDASNYIFHCTPKGDLIQKTAIPAEGHTNTYFFETEDGIITVILDESSAFFYDESLNLLRTVYTGQWYNRVLRTKDGSYILGTQLHNAVIIKEDSNQCVPLSERYTWDESFDGTFCLDENETLYVSTMTGLYHLVGDGSPEKLLFQWSDGMLVKSPYYLYTVTGDGDIIVSYNNKLTERTELKRVRLKKEQSERIQLTVGTFYLNEALSYTISAFNASQNTYNASLQVYYDYIEGGLFGTELLNNYEKDLLAGTAPDVMLFNLSTIPISYYDKNAYVDLLPHFGEQLLGSAKSAFSYQDKMFAIPVGIRIDTFLCKASRLDEIYGSDGSFTLEDLYALSDALTDGQVLSTKRETLNKVSAQSYAAWIDKESGTVSYDAPSFSEYITFCQKWDESLYQSEVGSIYFDYLSGGYEINNPALSEALATDQLQLLDMPLHSLKGYMVAKLLYADEDFAFCGYPTPLGQSMYMQPSYLLTANAASPALGGAGAFINFMLSDEIQTSPYFYDMYLPTTRSGLRTLMDRYPTYEYDIQKRLFSIYLGYDDNWEESYFISTNKIIENPIVPTETDAIAISMTEEDKEKLFAYLDTPMPTVPVDETVSGIIEEELSAWRAGAASLSDAAKRIQSRVFVYINE